MSDYVASWEARLLGRIYPQFRGTNIEDIARLIARQAQELEDAFWALRTLSDIDNSVGLQLRNLGRIVGQPWKGEDDATYRLRVKARIRVNLSSGNPEDMYVVFRTLLAVEPGHAWIFTAPGQPASMTFRDIDIPLDPSVVAVLFEMLLEASVDGVKLILEWPTAPAESGFSFAASGSGVGPGLGWGSYTDPTVGGSIAGAASS